MSATLSPRISASVAAAIHRLQVAAQTGTPCAPVRDLIGTRDVAIAYEVQQQVAANRVLAGATVVGRKIGLTAVSVQQQLGVDQPDFGVLFADMQYREDDAVPMSRLLQPKIEAEVAFVLRDDLADGPLDAVQVRAAVAYAVAALEIVDSRIAGWDISYNDTVADNASSGLFVLGADQLTLDEFDPVEVAMTMASRGRIVSVGSGAACLGNPLNALAWLATRARELGDPLRAGQVVLSGALGPMVAVNPGDAFAAELTGLGKVTATFSESDAS